MKRSLLIVFLVLTTVFSLAAQTTSLTSGGKTSYSVHESTYNLLEDVAINEPKVFYRYGYYYGTQAAIRKNSKEIGVVGRIVIKYDGDLDKIREYCGVADVLKDMPFAYLGSFFGSTPKYSYANGEFVCGVISKKNKEAVTQKKLYCYAFASEKASIVIPLQFKFTVPEDEIFLYVGTIVIELTGPDFVVKKISVIDEYAEAQKWLENETGSKDYRLCRVKLIQVTESQENNKKKK